MESCSKTKYKSSPQYLTSGKHSYTSGSVVFKVFLALLVYTALSWSMPAVSFASNTITVHARGNLGSEAVYLNVNGSTVSSWTVTQQFNSYSYTSEQAINQLRVGHNSGGWPNAVVVDYVEINGVRYESESPATYSVGSWNRATGCAPGNKESEWLSCNGSYFDYAVGLNLVSIRARGNLGTENVDLIINGAEVASWPVSTAYQTFQYTSSDTINTIRASHNSGGWPNAVIVDYVEVDGVRYESEHTSTFSFGSWDPVNRCAEGYKRSQWLSCNGGFFEYSLNNDGGGRPLVIYDTDMGPDIDDAVALSMLHSYQDAGMIDIAAITISRDSTTAARYVDAVNTYYGHPTIPIGLYRGGTVSDGQAGNDGFTVLAANYDHDVHVSAIEDGYKLIRRILANAAGRPVIIIQTGFSGTVSALLDSDADGNSSLNGVELVAATVDMLSVMAGRFDGYRGDVEFNIRNDLNAARNLIQKWPVAITMADWVLGARLIYPYYQGIRDKFPSDHPVRSAYEFRTLSWHRNLDPDPPDEFYNMASWDLTSVMQGIEPEQGYFVESRKGTIAIDDQGFTTFSENPQGKHTILFVPDNRQRTINRMVEVVE